MTSPRRSTTVYYARSTLLAWLAGASLLWIVLLGFAYLRLKERDAGEMEKIRARVRRLAAEGRKLRQSSLREKSRAAKLRARVRDLAEKLKQAAPPPAPLVRDQLFPLGEAVEIVPGRLYVTAARFEGGRLRVRMAELTGGLQANRNRSLAPGEIWRFELGGKAYILLLHALSDRPPGARISIREFGKE